MNIFAVSKCPRECASYLDDVLVCRMVMETAKILSSALRLNGYDGDLVYKLSHENHPVVGWCAVSRQNYEWTLRLFQSLSVEYTSRYDKLHRSTSIYVYLVELADYILDGEMTDFVNCAADDSLGICYKHVQDVHEAYRLYLNHAWVTDKREPVWNGLKRLQFKKGA